MGTDSPDHPSTDRDNASMSDPCAIGVLKKDGQVVSIRVRTGGLPEHAGLALVQSWNSPDKVQELLEDGDRLWLGDYIEEGRYEDHFEPPEDPNLECGAIAHASEKAKTKKPLSETEATTEKKTSYKEL